MLSDNWRPCWLSFALILLVLEKSSGYAITMRPSTAFSRYSLVQPAVHHSRTKREVTTRDIRICFKLRMTVLTELTMTLNIEGKDYLIDLQLNYGVVSANYTISYQKDGKTVKYKPTTEELDICQYSGAVRGVEGSWAALSTCLGVRGVIHDGEQMRFIEPVDGNKIVSIHYIYSHSDLNTTLHKGYERGISKRLNKKQLKSLNRVSRQEYPKNNYQELINSFKAGPTRYVELKLIADNREWKHAGGSALAVTEKFKDIVNVANSLFAPLNIVITLAAADAWNEEDEIFLNENSLIAIFDIKYYANQKFIINDFMFLVTHDHFEDAVGIAFLEGMCDEKKSVGLLDDRLVTGVTGNILAHEIGHALGMLHDDEGPKEGHIMEEKTSEHWPTHWSLCSCIELNKFYNEGNDKCLRNVPQFIKKKDFLHTFNYPDFRLSECCTTTISPDNRIYYN